MTTGDAKLVRRLRRIVRARRRRLPKQLRGGRPRGRQYAWRNLRWVLPVAAFFLPLAAFRDEGLFAIMALHGTLVLLRRVGELESMLREPGELWVSCFFPFANHAIFDAQTRAWHRSLLIFAADWIAFSAGMAVFREHTWLAWLGLPLAAAQAATAGAIAVRAARHGVHRAWIFGSLLLHTGAFATFVFGNKIATFGRWLSEDATPLILHATPAGLLGTLARSIPPDAWWLSGAALLLTACAVALAVWTRKTLLDWRRNYDAWPAVEKTAFEEATSPHNAEEDMAPAPTSASAPARHETDEAEVREALRAAWGTSLPATAFEALGPVEKIISRTFSPRQRRMLTLYGPPASQTHRVLVKALWIAVASVVAAALFGSRKIGVGGAIFAFAWLLPFWSGRWMALAGAPQGAGISPAHAFLPVSLWSLAGAYCTVGFARIIMATAVFAGALWPVLGAGVAMHHAALGGVLATAGLPLALIVAISDCTNDSSARPWRTLLVFPFGMVWLIFEVSVTVTMFMAENSPVRTTCAAGLLAMNFAALGLYLKAAGSRWFDLVRYPRG